MLLNFVIAFVLLPAGFVCGRFMTGRHPIMDGDPVWKLAMLALAYFCILQLLDHLRDKHDQISSDD